MAASTIYTRVLTRIQPGFASSVNAPNLAGLHIHWWIETRFDS